MWFVAAHGAEYCGYCLYTNFNIFLLNLLAIYKIMYSVSVFSMETM